MSDTHRIVVEIDPAKAKAGARVVDGELAGLEAHAKRASQEMSQAAAQHSRVIAAEARAASRAGRQAVREEAAAVAAARRQEVQAARQAARAVVAEARGAAAARIAAERQVATEAKATARAQAQAAREAADAVQRARSRQLAIDRADAQRARAERGGGGGVLGGLAGTGLGQLATVGGIFLAARQVGSAADSYTNLSNRIRTVTKDEAELTSVRARLFAISESTRTSIASTSQLYSTFGKGILDTGRSHAQTLPIIESVNKAVKLSGSSAQAAEAALVQLGQGMSAGALRGEELNSILEQAPVIADVLAKELGVTRGQLRALGAEGKITSDIIVRAFENARESLDTQFAKLEPTFADLFGKIGSSFTRLGNAIANNGLFKGAVDNLGRSVKFLADQLDRPAFQEPPEAAQILDPVARRNYERRNKLAFELQNETGIATGATLLGHIDPGDKLRKYGLSSADYNAVYREKQAWEETALKLAAISAARSEQLDGLKADLGATARAAQEFGASLADAFTIAPRPEDVAQLTAAVAALGERMLGAGRAAAEFGGKFEGWLQNPEIEFTEAETEQDEQRWRAARDKARAAAERERGALQRLRDETDAVGAARRTWIESEALVDRAVARGNLTLEQGNEILTRKMNLLRDQLDPLAAALRSLQEEADLLALDESQRARVIELRRIENDLRARGVELSAIERNDLRIALALQEQQVALAEQRRRAAGDDLAGSSGMLRAEMTGIDTGKAAFEKFQQEFDDEVRRLREMRSEAQKFAEALSGPVSSAVDGLVDGLLRWEMGWKDWGRSALANISQVLIQMLALKAIEAGFGAGGGAGGLGKFLFGIFGGTSGGNRAAGGSFLVGGSGGTDSQPVHFRATPGERVTVTPPGQSAAAGGAPTVNVTPKIVVYADLMSAVREYNASAEGERATLVHISNNPGKVRAATAR
jgi:tape measure domain-containing protein